MLNGEVWSNNTMLGVQKKGLRRRRQSVNPVAERHSKLCINHKFDTVDVDADLVAELCELINRRAKAAMADENVQHTDESMERPDRKD